ncbi:MAG TPA: bifunctional oligoribonuclease/PAP phosphatase NrnA [Treponemataceae bacterium]|jgi:phosphoesterase RecJ-like protein|nr:MAG: Bifunctional oligoribonuclease and PAP phosphatase NrnA [Spirochaetes bacterium ADurb.Bin269]HOC28829.1 bifunctional oligoribonuclease/PAP phosphatase NrnA [Treponemataceae bacterium]HPX47608.1 bifunctional oligoribonuclease/PAP phosphatase NrnA [Treponemataceae bacterium]HQL32435.1 bifunctional oligoribonuclease/PAP phosphatase NrnA [Treponemataceae bacterium]
MTPVPGTLISFLDAYDTYIIASHKEPDGDCIGSSLALDMFLRNRGKKTVLVSAGPFKRPEIKQYEHLFLADIASVSVPANTAVLVIDCSSIERLGDAANGLEGFPCAIIDHHATNLSSNSADYVDHRSPATTLLVQGIIETIQGRISKEEADCLLFGLCTDTGFFRHLDDQSASAFSYASRLVEAGANPKQTFSLMNGGKSWGSRILISRILSRMTRWYEGKLVVSFETLDDTAEFGQEGRDSDSLYQLIQSIEGVEAMVIVRQESETHCSVGFRSRDLVDVSKVATSFGGGGHKQASGLYIEGTIEALIPHFVEAFRDQLG